MRVKEGGEEGGSEFWGGSGGGGTAEGLEVGIVSEAFVVELSERVGGVFG